MNQAGRLLYLGKLSPVFLSLTVGVLAMSSAFAEYTPVAVTDLINASSRASRELDYDITFVYRKGEQMEAMRLLHKAGDNDEMERLISLTGQAREIIRDSKSVTFISPETRTVIVEKSKPRKLLPRQLPEPIEKIAHYYRFSMEKPGRILGRGAWIINIIPKDEYRYGYQLWIDQDSCLPLRVELKTADGRHLEQIMVTQLRILDELPLSMLKSEINNSGFTWHDYGHDSIQPVSGAQRWQVKWLPKGFSISEREQKKSVSTDVPIEHMIYSDGLAMVSVFVEKLNSKPEIKPGALQMGGLNTFATLNSGFQVTAVGEVPLTTVKQMAKSVAKEDSQ